MPFYATGNDKNLGRNKKDSLQLNLPGVTDESFAWTRSGLEFETLGKPSCFNKMTLCKDKASPSANRKDSTKTKEKLCGFLFYCYVFGLFYFSSNVPED